MKKLVLLAVLVSPIFTGCAASRLAKEVAKSNASASLTVTTLYGTIKFNRANPLPGQTATIAPDGTLTVTAETK